MIAFPHINKIISISDSGFLVVAEISSGEEIESLTPH